MKRPPKFVMQNTLFSGVFIQHNRLNRLNLIDLTIFFCKKQPVRSGPKICIKPLVESLSYQFPYQSADSNYFLKH